MQLNLRANIELLESGKSVATRGEIVLLDTLRNRIDLIARARVETLSELEERPAFSPDLIAGLELWLRSDLVALTGGKVSTWPDKSGNGNDFTQAVGANRPLYTSMIGGRTVLGFDGAVTKMASGAFLSAITAVNAYTVFMLVQPNSAAAEAANSYDNPGILVESNGNWGQQACTGKLIGYHWDGADKSARIAVVNGTSYRFREIFDGANINVSLNGGPDTTTAAGNIVGAAGTLSLGVTGSGVVFFQGLLGEVLVYNRALSANEQALVQNYLQAFWGV